MIYSKKAYNYKTKELGEYVLTLDEADCLLNLRKKYGDLRPEILEESHKKLLKEFDKLNKRLKDEKTL